MADANQAMEDMINAMQDGPVKQQMQATLDALRHQFDQRTADQVAAAKQAAAAQVAPAQAAVQAAGAGAQAGPLAGTAQVGANTAIGGISPDAVAVLAAAIKAAMGPSGSKASGASGNRTSISIKTPEQYKPSMDIDAWWLRANNFAKTGGIEDEKDLILQLTAGLSAEAYAIMYKAGYELETVESIEELERALKLIFGDQKTEAQWADEFNNAKQEATETAGYFVDRVKWFAMKAFPGIWALNVMAAQVQLVRPQVVKGLRSAHVRLWLIHSPPETLDDLRLRAVQYEKDETAATGKPAVAVKPASHLNASKPGSSNASNSKAKPSDRDQSKDKDDKKKGRRGKGGEKKDSAKGSGSGDKPWATTTCQLCKKVGHDAEHCFKLKNSQECTRCGRTGHETAECFRTKHKSGKALKANGVPVPDWFKEKYLDGDDSAAKKPEPAAAGSHLNAAGGASAETRPRIQTMQW